MRSVVEEQREMYDNIWSGFSKYGEYAPGEQYVRFFKEMTVASAHVDVLDAGCGSGKGALALASAGFAVTLCDLTDAGLVDAAKLLPFTRVNLWDDLSWVARSANQTDRFSYVYCCDVMEHLPTEYTMLVLKRLLDVTSRGLFLSISLVPDTFGVFVGSPLHLTVRDFAWWRDRIAEIGRLVEARDLLTSGLYSVVPR